MLRSRPNNQHPRKWAMALRREKQMAIGQQIRDDHELPQRMTADLTPSDTENDPYADIVGTC